MIDPNERFYSPYAIDDFVTIRCTVIDCDTRRWLQVVGPSKTLRADDDERLTSIISRYVDQLGPDDHTMVIDKNGELERVTNEDVTLEVLYPKYTGPLDTHQVVRRSELREVERVNCVMDLVEYKSPDGETKGEIVVFKYTVIMQRVEYIWREAHLLRGLRGNDLFVPFHRTVIDDVTQNILGFTTRYISGGTLQDYRGIFYFHWLKQITGAIDDLNLRYGILHLDLAPRNIVIDPSTKGLKLFNFNKVANVGELRMTTTAWDIDSVIFTVYAALTKDDQFVGTQIVERDVSQVEKMEEWKLQIPLEDGIDILAYKKYLSEWAAIRRTTKTIKHFSEATEPISLSGYIPPTPVTVHDEVNGDYQTTIRPRKDAEKAGDYVTRWERPAQHELKAST
ncbi:hypothetical protein MauCBS54593_002213 [Microsporum audouinii]